MCISVSFLTQSRFSMFRCTLCALSDAAFFFLWLSLQRTRSFAAPSATKNSADGSSKSIRAVPLYGLESYFFALTELGITQSATSPAKNDMAQRIAEQSIEARPLAKSCPLLFCPPSFMRHLSIRQTKKKSGSEEPPFHNSGYAIEKILLQAITEQPLLPRPA